MKAANTYRLARLRAGLTQRELAEKIGLPVVYVTAFEDAPRLRKLISNALGMKPQDDGGEPATTKEPPVEAE